MIFDTGFIIDLLRGNSDAVKYLEKVDKTSESKIITSITVHELWRGINILNIKEQNKIKSILQSSIILSLDSESSIISGEIEGRLIREGNRIDPEDAMIAGIAIKNKQKLVTRNIKHFSRINELKIETY